MEYVDGEYVMTNKITDKNLQEMRANMDESDIEEFDQFVDRLWGKQIRQEREMAEVTAGASAEPKRRGRKPKSEI